MTAPDAIERLVYELRADSVEVRLHLAEALSRLGTEPGGLRRLVGALVAAVHPGRAAAGRRVLTLTTRRRAEGWIQLAVADTGAWVLVVDRGAAGAERCEGGDDQWLRRER